MSDSLWDYGSHASSEQERRTITANRIPSVNVHPTGTSLYSRNRKRKRYLDPQTPASTHSLKHRCRSVATGLCNFVILVKVPFKRKDNDR